MSVDSGGCSSTDPSVSIGNGGKPRKFSDLQGFVFGTPKQLQIVLNGWHSAATDHGYASLAMQLKSHR